MKFLQKSCQRNKNINVENGLWNVCSEVIKDTTKRIDNKKATKVTKRVEEDFAEIVKMHEKLSSGENIDPAAVSGLVLGGIINIPVQHKTSV